MSHRDHWTADRLNGYSLDAETNMNSLTLSRRQVASTRLGLVGGLEVPLKRLYQNIGSIDGCRGPYCRSAVATWATRGDGEAQISTLGSCRFFERLPLCRQKDGRHLTRASPRTTATTHDLQQC